LREKINDQSSMKVVFWKLKKEIDFVIKLKNFKFFLNDLNYNYNVYILKVYLNTKLNLIKFKKKWRIGKILLWDL